MYHDNKILSTPYNVIYRHECNQYFGYIFKREESHFWQYGNLLIFVYENCCFVYQSIIFENGCSIYRMVLHYVCHMVMFFFVFFSFSVKKPLKLLTKRKQNDARAP